MNNFYIHNLKIPIPGDYNELSLQQWKGILSLRASALTGAEYRMKVALILVIQTPYLAGFKNWFKKLKLWYFLFHQATEDEILELVHFAEFVSKEPKFTHNPITKEPLDKWQENLKFLAYRRIGSNVLKDHEWCDIFEVKPEYLQLFKIFAFYACRDIARSFPNLYPKIDEPTEKNMTNAEVAASYNQMLHKVAGGALNYEAADKLQALSVLFDLEQRIIAFEAEREEIRKQRENQNQY